MRRAPVRPAVHLTLLTLAFVAAATAFALLTPVFGQPDEVAHVDMVRHHSHRPGDVAGPELRLRRSTWQAFEAVGLPFGGPIDWSAPDRHRERPAYPRFDDLAPFDREATGCRTTAGATTCQNYHYIHPPTYYLLTAPFDAVLDGQAFPRHVLGLRLVSVLLVAPLVPLSYYAARQVWPGATRRPLAVATLVAGFAPLANNAGAVNSDALLLAAAAFTVAGAARLLRTGDNPIVALDLGLATGLGLATKADFLAIAPAAALAVAAVVATARRGRRLRLVLSFAVPAAMGATWWVRNVVVEGALLRGGSEILRPARPGPWNGESAVAYAVDHVDELVGRFWGLYGQSAVEVPPGWRGGLSVAAAVLALVWLACRRWSRPTTAGLRLGVLAAFPLLLAAGALAASFGVYRDSGEVRGLLGRYLHPALPVLAVAAVAALAAPALRLRDRGRSLPEGMLTAAFTLVVAGLALASFALAAHGLYGSRSTSVVLQRAATVAPVSRPGVALAAVGTAWALAMGAATAHLLSPLGGRKAPPR